MFECEPPHISQIAILSIMSQRELSVSAVYGRAL